MGSRQSTWSIAKGRNPSNGLQIDSTKSIHAGQTKGWAVVRFRQRTWETGADCSLRHGAVRWRAQQCCQTAVIQCAQSRARSPLGLRHARSSAVRQLPSRVVRQQTVRLTALADSCHPECSIEATLCPCSSTSDKQSCQTAVHAVYSIDGRGLS